MRCSILSSASNSADLSTGSISSAANAFLTSTKTCGLSLSASTLSAAVCLVTSPSLKSILACKVLNAVLTSSSSSLVAAVLMSAGSSCSILSAKMATACTRCVGSFDSSLTLACPKTKAERSVLVKVTCAKSLGHSVVSCLAG